MAVEILIKDGTDLVWTSSGADHVITLTSLADAAYRQGAKGDFGATRGRQYAVTLQIDSDGTGADANGTAVLYMSWSNSVTAGTANDGGASGADAAYTGYSSNAADSAKQLMRIGTLPMHEVADSIQRMLIGIITVPKRYGSPVVLNSSGQAFGNTATDHRIEFHPIIDESQ